jgi:hypothetical protein
MSDNLDASELEKAKKGLQSLADEFGINNPIRVAVEKLVHRIRDIEDCLRFLPNVREQKKSQEEAISREMRETNERIDETRAKIGIGKLEGYIFHRLIQIFRQIDRMSRARPDRVMAFSLFLGLFASFEAYIGDLLTAIFRRRPELFNLIGDAVPFKEIVSAQSIDAIKSRVLTEYIEKSRRKSYIEQFESMEKLFSIELRKFGRWPEFVEASHRRNVIAHGDGIGSQQYLENCRHAGWSIPTTTTPGSLLQVPDEYLAASCRLVMEVGVKLGHSLWRKLLPEEMSQADSHLRDLAYGALYLEEWSWAAVLGEFATGQRNVSDERHERTAIVNYAIAIRYRDGSEAARKIMATKDWSASAAEYRLAEAILNDDEKAAATIMREIGRKGVLLEGEGSYQTWPLFREFRTKKVFLDTYQEIYGHDFISDLQEAVQKEGELSLPAPEVT